MLRSQKMLKPAFVLTALSLLLISNPVMSEARLEELGRLFTDAVQREKLDAVRHGAYDEMNQQKSTVSVIAVNGIVLRRGGKNVVWVNNKSSLEGSPVNGVKVFTGSTDPKRYHVPVMVDGKRVSIKPGQIWSDGTGVVKDNY